MYHLKNSLIALAGLLAISNGSTFGVSRVGCIQDAPVTPGPVSVVNTPSKPSPAPSDLTLAAFAQQPRSAPSDGPPQGAEDELVRLSKVWMDATLARDMKTLEELVADDFIGIFPVRGDVGTRAVWMANVRDPNRFQPVEWKYSNIRVRHHGENLAVVSSLGTWKGTINGQPHNDTGGLIDVWEKRRGKWQVVTRYAVSWAQLKAAIDAGPK